MTTLDKVLVSIDRSPLDGALRVLIGFVAVPVLSLLRQDVRSGWTLTVGLMFLLLCVRIVPVFMRKLLPLSPEVKTVWAERRQIAKRYDSFQWQKLFFIGIGLACYRLASREVLSSIVVVSIFCVSFGAIGLVRWYAQASNVRNTLVNKYVL